MPVIKRYQRQHFAGPAPVTGYTDMARLNLAMGQEVNRLAQGAEKISDVIIEAHVEKELEKQEAFLADALNQAAEQDREFMAGLFERTGKDAVNSYLDAEDHFKRQAEMYSSRFQTQKEQEAFKQQYFARKNVFLTRALGHQNEQIRNYREATLNGAIKQKTNDALMMRDDAGYVEEQRAGVEADTRAKYKRYEGDALEELVSEANGKFYASVYGALIEDDASEAEKRINQIIDEDNRREDGKKRLPENVKLALQKKLETALHSEAVFSRADEISVLSDEYAEQDRMVRETDPKIRSEVRSVVTARQNREKQLKADAREELRKEKSRQVLSAADYDAALKIATSVTDPDIRKELIGTARWLFIGGKTTRQPDPVLSIWFKEMIDSGAIKEVPDLFKAENNLQGKTFSDLSPAEMKDIYNTVKKKEAGQMDKLSWTHAASMFKTSTGYNNIEKPAAFEMAWQMMTRSVENGMAPTDDNMIKIIDKAWMLSNMTGEVKAGGWWGRVATAGYGWDKTYAQAVAEGEQDQWMPPVSEDERPGIIDELKKAGRLVNEDTIRLYKKHVILGYPRPEN